MLNCSMFNCTREAVSVASRQGCIVTSARFFLGAGWQKYVRLISTKNVSLTNMSTLNNNGIMVYN